jgi:Txe/YoeB family toxin of Txe-Axe toxin-antitoxin module
MKSLQVLNVLSDEIADLKLTKKEHNKLASYISSLNQSIQEDVNALKRQIEALKAKPEDKQESTKDK